MTGPTIALDSERILEDLESGRTLPDNWYTDPRYFEAERALIFGRSWQYAGTVDGLDHPGEFRTINLGAVPVLLVRGDDGVLRGFANVCRHRGSVVITEEAGCRKSLQCGYHAWTYDLQGRLLAAPGMKDEIDFDRESRGLIPLPVERWGPFLFVNPKANSPPLSSVLGELPRLVEATNLNVDRIRHRVRRSFTIRANWKVVVDNYLECYHCPTAHPSFCDVIDVRNYTVREYEWFSTQTAPARTVSDAGGVSQGFYAYLWPNFTINIYPGPGNVSINLFLPVAPDTTVALFDYCFVDEVGDDEIESFAAFVDQVQSEDTALCESVQVGLASGMLGQGSLMMSKEAALRHFQTLVAKALSSAQTV